MRLSVSEHTSSPAISWKRNLYAIWIAEFIAIIGFNTSVPIIPFYLQDLGIHDPQKLKIWVGISQALVSVAVAIFAPIWGKVADIYGRKPMLLRAMIGGVFVMGLMGFSTSPLMLVVLRTIQGAITGTVAAATVLVASTLPREQTGYGLGLLQTAVFLGTSVGPMLGGMISDIAGCRMTFFITAGLLAVGSCIIIFFVKEDFERKPVTESFFRQIIPDFSPIKASKELSILLILMGVVQGANSVVSPVLPLYIQEMSPDATLVGSTTGLIIGLSGLASALAAAGIGKVSRRLGYRRVLLSCTLGAGLLTLPQGFVDTPMQLLVFKIGGGIFLGGTMPSINAMIALRADPEKQGSIYGLSTSISAVGTSVGPMVGSGIAAIAGFPPIFIVTAGILGLASLFVAGGTRSIPQEQ